MRKLRAWLSRCRGLFKKQNRDLELAAELEIHLEMHIEDNLRAGMAPKEARRQALIKLGGVEQTKEKYRNQRGLPFLESFVADVRFGLRMLRKNPGFTAVAILTLAFGIGASTAIFSLANSALLKPPVATDNPNQLVSVFFGGADGHGVSNHSYADYLDYRRDSDDVLSGLAAYTTLPANLVVRQVTERVNVGLVSENYFSLLGVQPIAGRAFQPDENARQDEDFTAVISESLWRRAFGGSRDVAGKTIWLNNSSYNVIGVAPEQTSRLMNIVKIDVFVPAPMEGALKGEADFLSKRQNKEFMVVGRLRMGVSLGQAQAKFNIIADQLQKLYPEAWTVNRHAHALTLVPYSSVPFELRGFAVGSAGLLMGAVGIVLLIACNNLANFLLARGMTRKKEIVIRLALGATRTRLAQQLLTEALLVALLGGAVGLLFASWAMELLTRFTPNIGVPLTIYVSLDYRVLAFGIFVTLLTAFAFGLPPALQATKNDANDSLKEADQTQTVSHRHARPRKWLMVAQVAVSLVLLMCASIFLSALFKLRSIDLGFNPRGLALLSVDPKMQGYSSQRSREFIQQASERLKAVPGVEAVTVAERVPIGLSSVRDQILPDPVSRSHELNPIFVGWNNVDATYFQTMQIPILRGRSFGVEDHDGTAPVAIVNEVLAKMLWQNQDPLEQFIRKPDGRTFEVVGVAKTAKYESVGEQSMPFVYFSLDQSSEYNSELTFHIRTGISPESFLDTFRRQLVALDPALTVFDVQTMNEHLANSMILVRMGALLLGIFGGLALALSSLGLYGLMNYLVTQRTRELGIRVALGADSRTILKLVLKQGVSVTLSGAIIGSVFGFGFSILIASQLYGVASIDVVTLIGVVSTQFGIALLACWLPAWRATRVDPMVALRHE
jgi:predicted permease